MAKTKNQAGRRSKLDPKVQERIVQAIRAGNFTGVAAGYAGIGRRTFYRWMQWGEQNKSPEYRAFWEEVKDAEYEAEVRAVAMVQKHMADSWQAAMTYLERKFPERWGRKDRVQVDVDPRETLKTLLGFTDEEVDQAVDLVVQYGDLSGPE